LYCVFFTLGKIGKRGSLTRLFAAPYCYGDVRSLGCERVQVKNQVCHPELRAPPAKSVPFCKANHACILLQHDREQHSQSTAAPAGFTSVFKRYAGQPPRASRVASRTDRIVASRHARYPSPRSSMAPRPKEAWVRTLSSGHSAVEPDRQCSEIAPCALVRN
jgi:hypothetical protein